MESRVGADVREAAGTADRAAGQTCRRPRRGCAGGERRRSSRPRRQPHATGDATPTSDIDIAVVGDGSPYRLEVHEALLVSVGWAIAEEQVRQCVTPSCSAPTHPGWRHSVALHEPDGIAAGIKQQAVNSRRERVKTQCDEWVAANVTGLAEEVLKLVASLRAGDDLNAAVLRSFLVHRLVAAWRFIAACFAAARAGSGAWSPASSARGGAPRKQRLWGAPVTISSRAADRRSSSSSSLFTRYARSSSLPHRCGGRTVVWRSGPQGALGRGRASSRPGNHARIRRRPFHRWRGAA